MENCVITHLGAMNSLPANIFRHSRCHKLPFAAFLHVIQNVFSSASLLMLDLFYGVRSGWFSFFFFFSFLALSF